MSSTSMSSGKTHDCQFTAKYKGCRMPMLLDFSIALHSWSLDLFWNTFTCGFQGVSSCGGSHAPPPFPLPPWPLFSCSSLLLNNYFSTVLVSSLSSVSWVCYRSYFGLYILGSTRDSITCVLSLLYSLINSNLSSDFFSVRLTFVIPVDHSARGS